MKQLFQYFFNLSFIMSFFMPVKAQIDAKIAPLSVGDTMPDIVISNLQNHHADQVRISDFKGKLLILDFWATWCPTCYEYFPKLDQLQHTFGNQIQIILVNVTESKDTEEKIERLITKLNENADYTIKLPYVNLEPQLGKLFPFRTLPQYVWIDGDGKVRAITHISEVTKDNIQKVLDGGYLHTKQDFPQFDRSKPLPLELLAREDIHRKYRSLLTGYIEGIGGEYRSLPHIPESFVNSGSVFRFNSRLKDLLRWDGAIFDEITASKEREIIISVLPNSQIIFNKSNSKFKESFINMDDFNPEHLYTYELVFPDTLPFSVIKSFIREDFSRYFNFKVERVERKSPVYIVKSTPRIQNIISTFDVAREAVASKYHKTTLVYSWDRDASEKYIKNATIEQLLYWLNTFSAVPILIDEVIPHESQRYDFDFPTDIYEYTPAQLQAFLKGLGFEVVEEERLLPFVVFSDRY